MASDGRDVSCGAAKRPSARACWQAGEASGGVLYHGHYGEAFMAHAHEALTLIYVTGGAVDIPISGVLHRVPKGHFVAIGSNQLHGAHPAYADGWTMRSMQVEPGVLAAHAGIALQDARDLHFDAPVHSGRLPDAARFHAMHRLSQSAGTDDERRACFEAFMEGFGPRIGQFLPRVVRPDRDDPAIAKVRSLLRDDAGAALSIESVAEEIGLSVFALTRQFKKVFGAPPHVWRMQSRANRAAQRLRARTPLVDAALESGFADQSHMNRVFKKVFGVTPGQYALACR